MICGLLSRMELIKIFHMDSRSSQREVMIAQQDTPDDVNLTYYQLNEDSSKSL